MRCDIKLSKGAGPSGRSFERPVLIMAWTPVVVVLAHVIATGRLELDIFAMSAGLALAGEAVCAALRLIRRRACDAAGLALAKAV